MDSWLSKKEQLYIVTIDKTPTHSMLLLSSIAINARALNKLARELGISRHLIYRWRKEFESFYGGRSPSKMIPEEKEVAALKEHIRQIELED